MPINVSISKVCQGHLKFGGILAWESLIQVAHVWKQRHNYLRCLERKKEINLWWRLRVVQKKKYIIHTKKKREGLSEKSWNILIVISANWTISSEWGLDDWQIYR